MDIDKYKHLIPEIWKGRVIPPFVTDVEELTTYPDPDMTVYAFTLGGRVEYSQGFDIEIDGQWCQPVNLCEFCSRAYGAGWVVGCGWGYQED